MSFQEAPVDFCPRRTNIEYHVQYTPVGDIQYYEPTPSDEEGADGDGQYGWFPRGILFYIDPSIRRLG